MYAVADGIATVTMSRLDVQQRPELPDDLRPDAAFRQARNDDAVKVIVLRARAGTSPGTTSAPRGRDINKPFERAHLWWDHTNKARRRIPLRPRAGGLPQHVPALARAARRPSRWCRAPAWPALMLAWGPIIGQRRRLFQDPVVRMGHSGSNTLPTPDEPANPRIAKRIPDDRRPHGRRAAWQMGMVNKVVPRAELEAGHHALARQGGAQPRMGLALTKQAINHVEGPAGPAQRDGRHLRLAPLRPHPQRTMVRRPLGGWGRRAMAAAKIAGAGGKGMSNERHVFSACCARRSPSASAAATPSSRPRWAGSPTPTWWSPPPPAASASWLAPPSRRPAGGRDLRVIAATDDQPFGLNFHMFQPNAAQCVDLAIQYRLRAVSYGRGPGQENHRPLQGGRRAVHPHRRGGQARGQGRRWAPT